MTSWQSTLINNLIVFFVLGSLVIIIYCKVAKKTLRDLIMDIRGGVESE